MLKRWWNADFSKIEFPAYVPLIWIAVAALFITLEVNVDAILNLRSLFDQYFALHPEAVRYQPVFYGVVGFMVLYFTVFVHLNTKLAYEKKGKKKIDSIVVTHFLVNVIDIPLTLLILVLLGRGFEAATGTPINFYSMFSLGGEHHPFQVIIDFYNQQIPTVVELPYVLAILVTLVAADLGIYLSHLLGHRSRFFWYVTHRSHHTPEFLHPLGAGPVYAFAFFSAFPRFLGTLALSKLVYADPLLVELIVIQVLLSMTEKFNHSSVFYEFAFKNKFTYYLFRFMGNGPYHYTHHSAKEGEEAVNIANVVFNFWDRLFGTYKEPDRTKPDIGLTNQPPIRLNPLRLHFGGIATILYELKHNSSGYWFRILCGGVRYSPPVTKEFLIVSQHESAELEAR